MKKRYTFIFLTVIIMVITGVISFYQVKPRKMTEEQKQDVGFQNTLRILETLTQQPHVAGSVANYKVRDYLVEAIATLGLTPEVIPFQLDIRQRIQEIEEKMANDADYEQYMNNFLARRGYDSVSTYVRDKLGNPSTDRVTLHNILVKLDQPQADEGIMLVSHYDSVGTAPGAADDGIAVASMLHFLQTAVKDVTFKNDMYFLFTDGEEQGLLGAHHFVKDDARYKDKIKALFNFEARGNQGTLIMFESSVNNYDLVKHFNQAVAQPVAFSLATAVYERTPNDTDFSVFKRNGYVGLNFAMVEGVENYHALSDTVENLNKDTAYQYYQTVSGIGQYFGNVDLMRINSEQEGLFFPFLGLTIVVIPQFFGYLLSVLPLIFAFIVLINAKKNKRLSFMNIFGYSIGAMIALGLTFVAYSTSYMVTIPLTLFFLVDVLFLFTAKHRVVKWLTRLIFFFGVLMSTLLFVPLIFLIQVVLQKWLITSICFVLPIAFILLYLRKVLRYVV